MAHGDIPQVLEVDRESYPLPWPASAYRRELTNNQHARYVVLRRESPEDEPEPDEPPEERKTWRSLLSWPRGGGHNGARSRGRVVGYAGMWIVADEAHITTIAVRGEDRRNGFGSLLLACLIALAYDLGIRWVTLEVRVSNEGAQTLYQRYGFRKAGVRRKYYSDNNEDALIMTTDDITLNAYQAQFDGLKSDLMRRLNTEPEVDVSAPMLLAEAQVKQ
ncbi:MAG TPA: ribosomal protein S18-alanine N-acetyltransferase [Chloroflexota bacterium]|jgi:ribosomal-protein-alanine N-acetyltransferase|nr:ribosomal protein S18-alanine N-acetyltransferase [Chloroflexota bacterium]